MKKIITVVGARPQFIKAAAVSRVIRSEFSDRMLERVVHTGQHFDYNMSKVFFQELDIPAPHHQLNISGGNHGAMTGRMLEELEKVLLAEKPDWVLIYGDTNSTLAGSLAAAKLHIPVAHVEAGLRSFNMKMPEEVNRILSDRVSSLLFCPTETAVHNLKLEGIITGVQNVGDVMYDVALFYQDLARTSSDILQRLEISSKTFALATCHRAENTDDPSRLREILLALTETAQTLEVVLPLHPRTRKLISSYGFESLLKGIIVTDPLPFLDMVALEQAAEIILTDSGGIQKEAFFYGVPCVTMREETEWIETIRLGSNTLTGASRGRIMAAVHNALRGTIEHITELPYGKGDAAKLIVNALVAA